MTQPEEVLSRIEKNLDHYLGHVIELVRQPSISTQNIGISECAEKVRQMMERLGLRTEIFPTDGNPVVYGEYINAKAKRTLLFYNHYDVQPPDPLDQWASKPFEAEVREGKLYGRGTSDNKGTFTSRISALESILEVMGECPVNVKFMVEGEEEVGSPNLASFVEVHREQLQADGIIWEGSARDPSERPTLTLGSKGILYLEVVAKGPKLDQHSSKAPILPNSAWRLVWALSTMKALNGRVTVEGFYDGITPPSQETLALLDEIPIDVRKERELAGLERLEGDEDPREVKKRLYFDPALTINGIGSGYTGRGMKTIVPSQASAKIDVRLVPDMDPDDILRKIQNHLRKHGFADLEVEALAKGHPCRTTPETPLANVAVETARKIYGVEPIVYPNSVGSGAMYVPVRILKKPIVSIGTAYYGSGMHSPNEHIRLKDYLQAIQHVASILLNYK